MEIPGDFAKVDNFCRHKSASTVFIYFFYYFFFSKRGYSTRGSKLSLLRAAPNEKVNEYFHIKCYCPWRCRHACSKKHLRCTWENVPADVCPMKTQINLCICAGWSVSAVHLMKFCILGYPKCAQWRFWSDCTNVQGDLNLCWVHVSEGVFSEVAAHFLYPATQ